MYEFHRLKSDDTVPGSTNWLEGLIGEFPESGLVPTAYIYGLMGVSAETDGLHIVPAFNDVYETMGVVSTTYGGHAYGLEENRNGSPTVFCKDGTIAMKLCYQPPRFTTFQVTLYAQDGTSDTREATVDADGMSARIRPARILTGWRSCPSSAEPLSRRPPSGGTTHSDRRRSLQKSLKETQQTWIP